MKKSEYLQDRQVVGFVEWLAEQCVNRKFHLRVLRSRYSPVAIDETVTGLEGLLAKYKWKSSWCHPVHGRTIESGDWASTEQTCSQLADGLRSALQANDEIAVRDWSLCVLKWGGVSGAIAFLHEMADAGRLVGYLNFVQGQLRLNNPDFDDDLITDQGIKRFDAGLTKIHSILDDTGSPIYDSRVGAAISMLVSEFAGKGTRPPALLRFPVGDARGHQYRNPSDCGYFAAPRFYTSAVSRDDWARWQLRLGWILQSVLEKADIFKTLDSEAARLHACQGALFMAGYDLRCFDLAAGEGGESAIDNSRPIESDEPFRNIVPTSFTMGRVVPLIKGYCAVTAVENQILSGFSEWQVQHGGIDTVNYAKANLYPLKEPEFNFFGRNEQAKEDFINGGYKALLRLTGRISPSFYERENNCLHCVYFTGLLYETFGASAHDRCNALIEKGCAGKPDSANTTMSVGRSVGRHFELLDDAGFPTKHFHDYFVGDWIDLF